MKKLTKYVGFFDAETSSKVEFWPISCATVNPDYTVPGFSHRVIVNRRIVDWLSDSEKPSAKNALFFLEKHATKKDGP